MLEIRTEQPSDRVAIRKVHEAAFGEPSGAAVVDLLRERGKLDISLVAIVDHQVVGHIAFSAVSVRDSANAFTGLGLAPLGILPPQQNRGIGSALVQAGLARCRSRGADFVVVLGHPPYYPRFGFHRASEFGLGNEYGIDEAFMVLGLKPGVLASLEGTVAYAPEFREAEG